MRTLVLCLLVAVCSSPSLGQEHRSSPVKILLLGTFHFANPGLDVVKVKSADVMSPQRQTEIQRVVEQIKKFNPDKIFVEWLPERQEQLDSLYQQYRKGRFELTANEVYQLGFRVAADLRHSLLYGIDFRETVFPFDSLMKAIKANNQNELMQQLQQKMQSIQNDFNTMLEKSTITEMLLWLNTDSMQAANSGAYMQMLRAGDLRNHIGSYAASEWWRRNMVIYENMLKRLEGGEQRVVVLFGSGHTAVLHDLIKLDPTFEIIAVEVVLTP